jgi:CHAT domain-containing protein/tetratricopeptide (TPR) repeat protein
MRFVTGGLAGVLITSLAVGGARFGATSASAHASTAPEGTLREVPQASGAAGEREQGRALLHRGRAAEALVHLERALKAFQQSNDRSGEASTRDLMGELYERQGRYDLALEHYRAAHDLYAGAATGGNLPAAPVGGIPGAAAVTAGASASAALTTEESGYNAQLMLAKIGDMLYRRGDLAGARATYGQMAVKKPDTSAGGKVKRTKGLLGGLGVGIGSDNNSVQVGAPTVGGLLTVKDQLGHYREAILYATNELGLGRVDYQDQQLDSARKHFENVLAATKGDLPLLGKLGQSRRYRAAARTSLGDVAFRQGRYPDAVKLYTEALKGARDDKRLDLMWPAQGGMGRSLWRQAAAEKDQKKAGKMREDALASYREALGTIETIRQGSLRADESRTTFLATTREVFDEAAGAFAEMALSASSGAAPGNTDAPATTAPLEGGALAYAGEALGVVERGHARSLLDMLNEAGAEITEGVPADLLQKKRENQARQEEIATLLTGVSLGGGEKQKKSPEDLENELNSLQAEFDSIENQIRTASPRYAQLTAARPLALEEIRRQVLDDDTALLEYALGDARSYLFAVTRTSFTVSRLPGREEIEREVVAFRQQILPVSLRRSITDLVAVATDPQRGLKVSAGATATNPAAVAAYAQAAQALYKTTVEPAAPLFKQSRLLIVADGALNYIPFHALVTATPPAGADFSTLSYLLKTNESLFAPSASVVAAIRQQRAAAGAPSTGGMLIVADPVFDSSDTRARASGAVPAQQPEAEAGRALSFDSAVADVTEGERPAGAQVAARGSKGVLVRLAGTRAEAQQIARLASGAGRKADVWLDLQANEADLEARDLRQYRVLHFATHGLLNAERPQFTGIVLSLVGNREGADGFLRTDEVFNLRLGSPLVMLSACETGLGREKRGEGVMGLTRAFMYAGAPAVGVSLWSVADKSTADLMTDFYRNLLGASALTPSAALSAARLDMIAGKRFSAPFYWAPFVLVGDWK